MSRCLTAAVFLAFARFSTQMCYHVDGSERAEDVPCQNNVNSTCCGHSYVCLSNNICMVPDGTPVDDGGTKYVRGTCTDPTWTSPDCPLFCTNGNYDDLAGGEGMAKCDNTDQDWYYCIDGQTTNCSTGLNILEFSGTNEILHNVFNAYASPGTPYALTTIQSMQSSTSTSTSTSASSTSSTYTSQYTVDPSTVAPAIKTTWCQNQQTSCLDICGGATDVNSCDPVCCKHLRATT